MTTVYATFTDLQAQPWYSDQELIQLTDDAGTGSIDQAKLDGALAYASALVEGYVAATYNLDPAAPIPALLINATCDIARYRLYKATPPESVSSNNASAIRTLESIRSGRIKLDAGSEALPPRQGNVLIQSGDRHFSHRQMRDY